MALRFEFFPEEWNKLNEEVGRHPDLGAILQAQPDKDAYVQLAEIAHFCGVVIDGTFTPEEINKLCVLLTQQLYNKRTGIIIIH